MCSLTACVPFVARPRFPPTAVTLAGTHFTILCHFDCGDAGAEALRAAETAWEVTSALFGLGVFEPTSRPIHLYATAADYEAVEAVLTGGRFRQNRAFSYRGREAHVAVHPNLTPAALAEFGLTSNTLRVIAHEAAHIATRTLAARSRALSTWLDEGLAASLEQDVMLKLGLAPGRSDEPVSGTRAYQLQERLRTGTLPSLDDLLDGEERNLTLGERYAFYQVFFDFARSRYGDPLLAVLRTLDTIDGSGSRLRRTLVRAIFAVDMSELADVDREFRGYVRGLVPGWVQARRALSPHGDDAWLQVGFDAGAEAWRWSPVPTGPFRLGGTVRILAGGAETAALLIALEGGSRLAVVLRSGEVSVERRASPGDPRPEPLRTVRAPVRIGTPLPFAVDVARDAVTIRLGDAEPLRIPGVRPSGRWGIETGPAANVEWRGLAVNGVPVR